MVKPLSVFVLGLALGGAAVWAGHRAASAPSLAPSPDAESAVATVAAAPLSCEGEVVPLRARVLELEGQLQRNLQARHPAEGTVSAEPDSGDEAGARRIEEASRWRVSAIEKFVPLSDDQKERLAKKFADEAGSVGGEETGESLEDILGEESATYYREQVKAAFQRVQDEETEKEVVWLGRQLSLSPEQEQEVRGVYSRVEAQVEREMGKAQSGGAELSAQNRVRRMVQENRLRSSLRSSMLKEVLSKQQYEAYLKSESESAASDMEVFHDPGH